MAINVTHFGSLDSRAVDKITIDNGILRASVISFGATLCELYVPDKNGEVKDVVCGYDGLDEYLTENGYLGATVGRYANRIAGGRFALDGKEYVLYKNEPNAHLHGGAVGFSHRIWDYKPIGENAVKLTLLSPDGDEGYPGELAVSVTYELCDNALCLTYEGLASKRTPVNMTNHSYFNIDGYDAGSVLMQSLYIPASHYDEVDGDLIPVGAPLSVTDTEFDFRKDRKIERGYDHNFVLDKGQGYGLAARLTGQSGRVCEVYTDLPAIQIYTAGGLSGKPMKGGVEKTRFGAICLETQYSPNSPNRDYMPSCIYGPGRRFESVTKFVFDTK